MPIAINGAGTITGISAGGLPDSCITTDDIAANAVTAAKLGADQASGLAKAWVNFNGTGTVAIRASFNVSSITDNGTGDYTVNFTTAMPDTNYAIKISSGATSTRRTINSYGVDGGGTAVPPTTTSVRLICFDESASAMIDIASVSVAIFR